MRVRHRMAVVARLGACQLGLRLGQGGVAGEDEVGRALVGLRHLLRDFADAPAWRNGDVAGVGVQPVGEKREQRRLAGAVAADQADLFARLDGEAGAIENELDAATQRNLGENEHGDFRRSADSPPAALGMMLMERVGDAPRIRASRPIEPDIRRRHDLTTHPDPRRRCPAGGARLPGLVRAQGAPVRVGYAIARTGPWTGGAQVSQEPNYLLWAEQQNAAGGLNVKGAKRPIELISYDDRSDTETCVRTYEKLMGSDKVDLILPPWGSNANFAVAPLANRFGYPLLAPTALSRKLVDMKLPYFFSLLQQPEPMMDALVDMLKAQRREERRRGLRRRPVRPGELRGAEGRAAEAAASHVVEDKSYPLGVKDLAPVLRSIKDKNPDAFIGITYPPDTILASQQTQGDRLQPEVLLRIGGHGVPALQERDGRPAPRACSAWARGTARPAPPPRPTSTPTSRSSAEGARPLGQRRLLGGAGDPAPRRSRKVGLDRKAHARLHRGHRAQDHPGRRSSSTAARTSPRRARWASGRSGEFEVVWPQGSRPRSSNADKPAWK